ncbi:short-chain dehydrogenase [Crepidotus variabilis]|uniref:Short-chain dehydrogenase n=1 Tax=Crepidotus variabilis TaxID=179855 RepID=A0A9P6ET51_9AGAR|nr:short-chain dehydrogenase [Crepidotus variabilis]
MFSGKTPSSSLTPAAVNDLSCRIAIVTGGGTGIGLMIAQGLAAANAKVYITGRRLDVLEKIAKEWSGQAGGQILPLQMDVTDKESIIKAKKYIEETEGKLHILVNNAGQVGPKSLFMHDPVAPEKKDAETLGLALFNNEDFASWGQLLEINLSSIFFVSTAFLGLLAKGSEDVEHFWSSIVNTTSISGIMKQAQAHFCYNSAKAAASHLTRLLSTELALNRIPVRVNAIAPGVYESEMTSHTILPEEVDKVSRGIASVPARRAGTAQEMAGTAVYLVSRAGAYVNGQEIIVDGGFLGVNPARS